MFKKEKKGTPGKGIDTYIGQKTAVSGKLHTKGIVRIDGMFEGDIITESTLIAGKNADIKGNIQCLNAAVAGRVQGNIEAEVKLEILKPGSILGDINAGMLMIEDGAFFSGNCVMNGIETKMAEGVKDEPPSILVKKEQAGFQEKHKTSGSQIKHTAGKK